MGHPSWLLMWHHERRNRTGRQITIKRAIALAWFPRLGGGSPRNRRCCTVEEDETGHDDGYCCAARGQTGRRSKMRLLSGAPSEQCETTSIRRGSSHSLARLALSRPQTRKVKSLEKGRHAISCDVPLVVRRGGGPKAQKWSRQAVSRDKP